MEPQSYKHRITVDREPLDLKKFDIEFGRTEDETTLREKVKGFKESCSLKSLAQGAYSLVPIIETLRTYQWKQWLFLDFMAGVSVSMVHIPQSMGFSLLAGLAPVYGLYATFWQCLFYMFLGHCRHLSVGTMAVISLMINPVVEREALSWRSLTSFGQTNVTETVLYSIPSLSTTIGPLLTSGVPELTTGISVQNLTESGVVEGLTAEDMYRSSVANGMSLIVGLTMLAMGILRLGILTSFMPPSFISGFTTAASFHIVTTQLKGLFNVKVKRYGGMFNLPLSVYEVLKALPKSNPPDVVCSVICFAILLFVKEFINVRFKHKMKVPIPAEMIIVVLGTLLSYLVQFHERWGMKIIGFIPVGIPAPAMPNLEHADTFILEGIITGITSFAISISMVEILAGKHKYLYDPNKELVAYGVTYGLSSFFHCFAGAAAPPRCIVMEMTGGKSQVASFFTVIILMLVLLVIGPLFRFLPNSCLSCIIIVALIPLFKQFSILPKLWRLSKPDLLIWIVTFLVSVIVDVSVSLGVGIIFALIVSMIPSMFSRGYRYGTTMHADLLTPLKTHRKCVRREDIAVFRYENTLHYLTIKSFKKEIYDATVDPRSFAIPETVSFKLRAIILDCSPIYYIDLLGIETLKQLFAEYKRMNVKLTLADCNPYLLKKLAIAGLNDSDKEGFLIFPTAQDGIHILSETLEERTGSPQSHRVSDVNRRNSSASRDGKHVTYPANGDVRIVKEGSLYRKRHDSEKSDDYKEGVYRKRHDSGLSDNPSPTRQSVNMDIARIPNGNMDNGHVRESPYSASSWL